MLSLVLLYVAIDRVTGALISITVCSQDRVMGALISVTVCSY